MNPNRESRFPNPDPPSLTPEQFRRMLEETLAADPTLARRVPGPFPARTGAGLWPLAGTVFPFMAGAFTNAEDVRKGTFGTATPGVPRTYTFLPDAATTVPLIVKAAASQSADLQQWQNSAGSVLAEVTGSGRVGIGTPSPIGPLHVALAVNQLAKLGTNGIGSGVWLVNGGFLSQASEFQIAAVSGATGINFYTGGTVDSMAAGTSRTFIRASDGNVGIGTANPSLAKLQVEGGDIYTTAGLGFYVPGEAGARNVLYRGGTDFTILRNFNQTYTLLQVWSPPGPLGSAGAEASLALVRGDEPNQEYMDVYNINSPMGIRIVKAGTGVSQNFSATSLPLPKTLGGVTLRFGGTLNFDAAAGRWNYSPTGSIEAPLLFVGPNQINFQLPPGISLGDAVPAQLTRPDGSTLLTTLRITATAPGIFSVLMNGQGQAAVLNQDNSPNFGTNPAKRGSVIQIFATGAGDTDPPLLPGEAVPLSGNPLILTRVQPTVMIGAVQARVLFSGMAPGFVGLWQINAEVLSSVTPGPAVALVITAGGMTSNTVTIAVE